MNLGEIRRWLQARGPWAQSGLTFLAGLGAGLGFAPTYFIPLWLLGFALTLALIFWAQRWPMRLWLSFLFSYGSMITGLYWIALAPAVAPEFYFLIPLALIVLPAFAALFGTAALFLAGFWRRDPVEYALIACAAWMLFEWRRGIDLTGFGWNRAGMIWSGDPLTLQLAAFGGVPLLSLVTVLVGAGIFLSFLAVRRWGLTLIALPLLFLIAVGAVRLLAHPQGQMPLVPDTTVRLVQANIPRFSFDGTGIYEAHMALSTQRPLENISHVIWPEGSIRALLDQDLALRQDLATRLAPARASLVFGRRSVPSGDFFDAHLSAYLIDHATLAFAAYDKSKLVPFGEYIPYERVFERLGFAALTGQFINRVPGQGAKSLDIGDGARIGAFICYDSIATGQIVDRANRPDWMATITEDAWYILPSSAWLAHTPGPYQHLAESRIRAVEEGLSLARASNPGISGVFDPLGRDWSGHLPLNTRGTIDSSLPAGLSPPPYTWASAHVFYLGMAFFPLTLLLPIRVITRL